MPRRSRTLIQRGDIWDAEIPGAGVHPVVIVTRDTAIPLLSSLVCVLVTSTYHYHVAEVALGPEQGLAHECAANCDNVFTLPTKVLSRRRGHLAPIKLAELDTALTIALGLDR
jgi:mRNA interferase MazF